METMPLGTIQGQPDQGALRLVGIELRSFTDDTTLALTPSGRLYSIEAPPSVVYQLLKECDGSKSIAEILSHCADPDGFSEVIDTLLRDGCLRCTDSVPDEPGWIGFNSESLDPARSTSTHVVMIGDNSLTSIVRDLQLIERFASVDIATFASLERVVENNGSDATVIVALRERFDQEFLIRLNDFCETHKVRWTQFHISHRRGWLGPSVVPGSTPNYQDLLLRRLSGAENIHVFQALTSPALYDLSYLPPMAEVIWMLSFFMADIQRWIAGAFTRTLCHEVEMDPATFLFTLHPILPLPDRQLHGSALDVVKGNTQLLLDERTGLITNVHRVEHHPSVPLSLTTAQSRVADMNRLYPWANNTVCQGSTFGNYHAACEAAIGEGLERYCGNWIPTTEVLQASYHELKTRGEYAIDPDRLSLYSESQYYTPGFPFIPFTRDLQVQWVRGWSLTLDKPAWIPANLVYVNWYTGEFASEPPTTNLCYAGIAAGPTLDFAITSGIEEVIERDATMIWWMNRQPLPAIVLTRELAALWEGVPCQMGQRAWLIHLDNEFGVPVMAGVVENVEEKLFNIGFAARPDPVEAALKSWTEALTLQEGSRDLLDPNGAFWQGVVRGQLDGRFMKAWRADRAYLDDYRPDYRDMSALMCQQQVFLDPRARVQVKPWVDIEITRKFEDLPRLADRSLASYQKVVEEQGYEIFYIDVTTPDVALTGMRVVRVIVPGLVSNFPAAFPFLGRGRIQNAALKLGWRSVPLAEHELNYFPLPHA
ncbi:MAG TPA: YcaO-like family protein [Ktedonobacteraceae bacterium]|nr:YcaO-like family protein [Ktedonobacteraceae bacterium]